MARRSEEVGAPPTNLGEERAPRGDLRRCARHILVGGVGGASRSPHSIARVLARPTGTDLTAHLLSLEGALKQESLEPSWAERRDAWRAKVGAYMVGNPEEVLLACIEEFAQGIAWDRLRLDEEGLEVAETADGPPFESLFDDFTQAEGDLPVAALSLTPPVDMSPKPAPHKQLQERRHSTGLGKRPRSLDSANDAGRGNHHKAAAARDSKRAKASQAPAPAQVEVVDPVLLAETPLPCPDEFRSGPPGERVPTLAMEVLAVLERAGLRGRYEGDVILQLMELVHRHLNAILSSAEELSAHRLEATRPEAGGEVACPIPINEADVRMALEFELRMTEQSRPPPREVLVASGCGALNLAPLPLPPEDMAIPGGVVLPQRAVRRGSLSD